MARLHEGYWEIDELCGNAGDVCLMHPFLVHARGKNLGTIEEASVRFLSHPCISLKSHMNLTKAFEQMSPLEYSIASLLHQDFRDQVTPENCAAFSRAREEENKAEGEEEAAELDAAAHIQQAMGFSGFSTSSLRKGQYM